MSRAVASHLRPVLSSPASGKLYLSRPRSFTRDHFDNSEIRGTDPSLRSEYVLFSSHQDHDGVRYTVRSGIPTARRVLSAGVMSG